MIPRYAGRYEWTQHSRAKMRFYHLSEARVKRVLHTPSRVEEGIAQNTTAVMQRIANRKRPYEIWVMLQTARQARRRPHDRSPSSVRIISVWRYPGITRPGDSLPEEILQELHQIRL